ncbi:MAG: mechanosensitive ion channel family protein [Coriobacteriia bacterium]|nr:mechanosensitive ion channel family protein [Coriobacteriia bacterium]MBN2848607.1 mechanosensitive ion channel family protein [Coriobacteriia bacterium]
MTIMGLTLASDALVKVGIVLSIIVATGIGMRAVGKIVRRSMSVAGGVVPATSMLVNIARGAILVIGALAILSVFDISITPLLTALGVGGLAVSLALQDTLGNLFAGLQIIATKQIRPGDYLVLESGHEGTVIDIAWRTTTLRTTVDNLVIVPNAVLGQAIVTNYKLPAEAVAVINQFGVSYGVDLDQVERVTLEVAEQVLDETGYQSDAHPPVFRFQAFADSQITCAAILYVPSFGEQFALRSVFIRTLYQRFAAEGIHFPFPTRTVHVVQE